MNTEQEALKMPRLDQPLAIQTCNLAFRWPGQTAVLHFPDIALPQGQHLFLHGPSGSGKSSLLGLLAGMQRPISGSIKLLGCHLDTLSASARDRFRADHAGVIFQQFNLVPYLSAMANTLLPCRLSRLRKERSTTAPEQAAETLLTHLGITRDHWYRYVGQLSIGQQQRVAAARALIGAPELILADEPTSALDTDNRDRFLNLLLDLARERNSSVVFVSHDQALARHFDQRLNLEARP